MVGELPYLETFEGGAADDDPDHARREPSYFCDLRGKTAALGHLPSLARSSSAGRRRVVVEQGVEVVGQPSQHTRGNQEFSVVEPLERRTPARLHQGVALGHQLLAALSQRTQNYAA